jgi:hypothetical protein
VVGSMTPATEGQTRVFAGREGFCKRPQAKNENQQYGERTPHLGLIVQDGRFSPSGDDLSLEGTRVVGRVSTINEPQSDIVDSFRAFPTILTKFDFYSCPPPGLIEAAPGIRMSMVFAAGDLAGAGAASLATAGVVL